MAVYYVDTCYKKKTKYVENMQVGKTTVKCLKCKVNELLFNVPYFRFVSDGKN